MIFRQIFKIAPLFILVNCSRNEMKESVCDDKINYGITLGDIIPSEEKKSLKRELWLTSANQTEYCYLLERNDIDYKVKLDSSGHVKYIQTSDSNFIYSNWRVGIRYGSISNANKSVGHYVSGWGYNINLDNGWIAVFSDSSVLNTREINPNSKLSFFYKTR